MPQADSRGDQVCSIFNLDENGQDALAQHTGNNTLRRSPAPFRIPVWRPPPGPFPPGAEEALEIWRQPQYVQAEDGIEMPFDRWWNLQRPRTTPLLDISNECTWPVHPLPPENCITSPPYITRRPPHRVEDLDDSSLPSPCPHHQLPFPPHDVGRPFVRLGKGANCLSY